MRRLEETGIIESYRAVLNRNALGFGLSVFIAVTLDSHTPERFSAFEEAIKSFPEVVRASIVTGRAEDYMLQVLVSNMEAFEAFLLSKLNCIPGVTHVHSSFEMRSVIDRQPPA